MYLKLFSYFMMVFLSFSCVSEVYITMADRNSMGSEGHIGAKDITMSPLELTSVDFSQDVYLTVPFSGDSNNDVAVVLYFCSIKVQPGCDPMSGESVSLTKSGSNLVGSISIALSSQLTPGDIMKYQLATIDADGVTGGSDYGYILIPYDGSVPRSIRQLGLFSFGSGTPKYNAGSDDYIYASAVGGDGSLYFAGRTKSSLGEVNNGGENVVIIKLTPAGNLDQNFANEGVFQLGIVSASIGFYDSIETIVLDDAGNLFAAGYTYGSLGGANAGSGDGFILKINANSGVLDTAFGDGDGSPNDGIVQINASNSADASSDDSINSIAHNGAGSLFVGGETYGSLGGVNAGSSDGFILKMNANSGVLDTAFGDGDGSPNDGIVQLNATNTTDASSSDYIKSIVLDGAGDLFVGGYTSSSLGGANAGGRDGFIVKMNASSGVLDTAFGDGDGSLSDGIVQLNATNTGDASSSDNIRSISLDGAGNLFAAGYTFGSLGGANAGSYDGFIVKMNASSGVLDTAFGDGDGSPDDGIVQLNATNSADASSNDFIQLVFLDGSGNLFVGGYTEGSLGGANAGGRDGFIVKMNASSGVLDTSFGDGDGSPNDGIVQLNTTNTADASSDDFIQSFVLDGAGNLFVGGYTEGSLGGANAGGSDGFILKMNASSGVLDTAFGDGDGSPNDGIIQLNTTNTADASSNDYIRSIVLDGAGNLFAAGYTEGSLGGANAGGIDGFILKMNASSGVLDTAFGDGDGTPNDGIVQINASNSADASFNDYIQSIGLDAAGDLFAAGYTSSSLGGINAGSYDAFILKMDTSSGVLDTAFGDGDGSPNDGIVQLNATNTGDASSGDFIQSIVLDAAGDLFATGYTSSSLGGANAGSSDGFIVKMNVSSGVLDTSFGDGDGSPNDGIVQLNATNVADASSNDFIQSIVLDGAGNLFAAGNTQSSLGGANAGGRDGFILKMNASSGVLDTAFGDGDDNDNDGIVQLNAFTSADASSNDFIQSIDLDGVGNLFAAGNTQSSLGGANAGSYDGFIVKMNASSGVLDTAFGDGDGTPNDGIVQLNATNVADASSNDYIRSIVLDGAGNLFVGGYTQSSLGGVNAGNTDVVIIKMDTSSGVLDTAFGDGDGSPNDGIVQLNATNTGDASSGDFIQSIVLDGAGNLFAGGDASSSLGGVSQSSFDTFTIMISAGDEGL